MMADVSSITERLFLAFPKRQTKAALVFGCGALSAMSAIHTAGLYHAGAFPKIFVSGGVFVKDTEGYADLKNLALGALKEAGVSPPDPAKCEAEYMKDILVASGVPEDAIVVEDKSENMGENIQKSLALGLEDAESITFVLLAINARRGLMRLRKERPFPKPIVTLASVYPLPGIDRTNWDKNPVSDFWTRSEYKKTFDYLKPDPKTGEIFCVEIDIEKERSQAEALYPLRGKTALNSSDKLVL